MNPRAPHGWLILDKPLGVTSAQALNRLKCLLPKHHKIGHAGTLDPLASGVLPVALGEATKTVAYIMAAEKEYAFTVQFGARTATGDKEGAIIGTSPHRPSQPDIEAALPRFTGTILQTPPAYSAIKQDGARAYDKARRGENVSLTPREIIINSLKLIDFNADSADFHTSCGKGTYIRVLGEDLARYLGTEGHIARLRRTRVGRFALESAISLEKLQDLAHKGAAWPLVPLREALDDIPAITVNAGDARRIRHGQRPPAPREFPEQQTALLLENDVPLAIAQKEAGCWKSVRGFNFDA